tara:strand:- start:9074 stop:9526 length:453 start_codon:yes stop_codon:yes gene_type:complete
MTYLRKRKQQNLETAFTANTASQTVSTTVLDITNSEVTFTPPSGNFNFVVYEYTIQYHHDPDNGTNFFFELREKIGSGAYAQLGDGYRAQEIADTQLYQSTLTGRFLIPIYSGARSYKLTIRSSATNREGTLHSTRSGGVYSPIIQMYCV